MIRIKKKEKERKKDYIISSIPWQDQFDTTYEILVKYTSQDG